jgi:hypothetical protein
VVAKPPPSPSLADTLNAASFRPQGEIFKLLSDNIVLF